MRKVLGISLNGPSIYGEHDGSGLNPLSGSSRLAEDKSKTSIARGQPVVKILSTVERMLWTLNFQYV